jgi:hypothetical protein
MRFALAVLLLLGCSAPAPATKGSTVAPDGSVGKGPHNADCRLRVGLRCGDGKVDGCGGGRTLIHICIPETEQPGPACSLEINKQCPTGQVDACLKSPPVANTHLCVF